MFAKMLLIILTAGAIASSLLVLRQQKVETIHEISQAYHRQRQYERALWKFQAEIARRCRPEALREKLLEQQADWKPIPALPSSNDATREVVPEKADTTTSAKAVSAVLWGTCDQRHGSQSLGTWTRPVPRPCRPCSGGNLIL